MKKKIGVLLATLSILVSGCGTPKTEPQEEEVAPLAVEVMTAKKGDISSEYVYAGKVAPIEEANVFSTIQGKVGKVHRDVGDHVQKGETLFEMETTDLVNQLNVLKGSLATTEANIQSAKTTLDTVNGTAMQTQIETAKAGLANAELAYQNAKESYEDNKRLFDSGIISEAQMEQIQLNFDKAKVSYDQAKASYDIVVNQMPEENLRKAQDGYNIAVASKKSVEAQIASAQKSLRDAVVKSPISGVITQNNVVAGTVLSQSQPAFTVMDTSMVEIAVGVSEQVINTLQEGQKVKVKLTAIKDQSREGTIASVNPAANPNGTYDVKVQMENPEGIFKVGMLGEVYFAKETSKDVFVVPRNCVINKDKKDFVYIEEKGVAKKVFVETGIDTGEEIEITKGLSEGMRVVFKGQTYLNDGAPVSISASNKGKKGE